MCAEELYRENEVDLHLKKKEVVQKLAELSEFENELIEREQALEQLKEELTKKEKHLTGWESEIKKIAAIVADEKKRIDKMTESFGALEGEPQEEEPPVEVEQTIPGEVENPPEEEEPSLEEPDQMDIIVAEDLLSDLIEDGGLEEDEPEEMEAPNKRPVKKVVRKKKKKFGFFK